MNSNNAPVFTDGASTQRSVDENVLPGNDIGDAISATDTDDDSLTYTLSGTDVASFNIVSTTGQIQTKAILHFDTKNIYRVTVTVSDGRGGSDTISVTILVGYVDGYVPNINFPSFTDGNSTTRSIAENTAADVAIGTPVAATDADETDELTYTLGGTDAASFSIDSMTGQLKTKIALNYEQRDTYTVVVTVSDGRGGTDTITVTINITNVVNEGVQTQMSSNNAPVFTDGASTQRSVDEGVEIGTNVGAALLALDADNDVLTYTLGGTDSTSFTIESTTGQIKTNTSLRFETKPRYSVTVSVSDSNNGTDSIDVTINVQNVNRGGPVFAQREYRLTLEEVVTAGSDIGNPITASDIDDDDLYYFLTAYTTIGNPHSDDFLSFTVNNSGQIRTKINLTNSGQNVYKFSITSGDGRHYADTDVIINVVKRNRTPVFSDGASATRAILENRAPGLNIGTPVAATDADNDTLIYTLSGTDAASFDFNSTTGQIITKAALDYEANTSHSVTVTVTDNKPRGSVSIPVTINVTNLVDENNNVPTFTDGDTTTRSIAENTAPEVNIGTAVAATDLDNDTLIYTLSGVDASSFSLDSTTGQIKTKASLDHEAKSSYSVTLTVSDTTIGGTDTITVTINVTNVVEANTAPEFVDGVSTDRSINENTAAGVNIGNPVSAIDADRHNTLTYTLSGTDAASFDIVSSSGQLQTKASLDFETKRDYMVTVSVSDGENGTDSITVTINVLDVVDTNRVPVFQDGSATVRSIVENTSAGERIGSAVSATDPDNDSITYTLSGTDAGNFTINATTGQLKTSGSLDYETQPTHNVTITATDSNEGTATITVRIDVIDSPTENHPPSFTDGETITFSMHEENEEGRSAHENRSI